VVAWGMDLGDTCSSPIVRSCGTPPTCMAAGEGLLVVVAGNRLVAYVSGTAPPPICSTPAEGAPAGGNPYSAMTTSQYRLTDSDGQTWKPLDSQGLSLTVRPPRDAMTLVTGNADLWTANEI